MKDYETDPSSIWKSEIFGRSLDAIVQEGIQSKINMMPDNIRFKLQNTFSSPVRHLTLIRKPYESQAHESLMKTCHINCDKWIFITNFHWSLVKTFFLVPQMTISEHHLPAHSHILKTFRPFAIICFIILPLRFLKRVNYILCLHFLTHHWNMSYNFMYWEHSH